MKNIIILYILLATSFSMKADTFTINMYTFMGSALRNSGWIVRDELGNELASYFGEYSDSSTTNSKQITISGGPYYLEGRNETFNSEPIYDYVIFEVVGSSPYISFYIPFLLGPYLSVPFKASYLNPVNFGNLEVLKNNNFDLIHFNTITENNCNKFIIQNRVVSQFENYIFVLVCLTKSNHSVTTLSAPCSLNASHTTSVISGFGIL